jgi:hypothetical protein
VVGLFFGCVYPLFPFTGPGWALAYYAAAGFGASFSVIVLNVRSASF